MIYPTACCCQHILILCFASSVNLGRGGRGGKGRGSHKTSSPSSSPSRERVHHHSESEEMIPSGYDAPFHHDDAEDVSMESLAFVEKPTRSIPAFFFFILHNRHNFEKHLLKKSRVFRSTTKSLARNEMVAEVAAAYWVEATDREKRTWVQVSMRDLEDRMVAWKEKEAIEAMMEDVEIEHHRNGERKSSSAESSCLTTEDERHAADALTRMLQFSKVKANPLKANNKESNNSVLLELLHDIRFQPIPLFDSHRDEMDLVRKNDRVVEQFAVQGPIKTR